jgi:polyphenol oxidase
VPAAIKPLVWNNDNKLLVAFSTSHAGLFPDDDITGLNIGLNTIEDYDRVWEKRRLLLNELNMTPDQVVFARQVHSSRVDYVTAPGTIEGADGFVTDLPGLGLAIQVADCAAVFIADTENGVIGAAHAGWKGAAGNILIKTLNLMRQKGGDMSKSGAWISPCISTAHFEVGEEVAELFPREFVFRQGYAKPHIDLKGFVVHQLEESGIAGDRIYTDPGCTYSDSENYFSYRREKQRAGRMMGIIMLR